MLYLLVSFGYIVKTEAQWHQFTMTYDLTVYNHS